MPCTGVSCLNINHYVCQRGELILLCRLEENWHYCSKVVSAPSQAVHLAGLKLPWVWIHSSVDVSRNLSAAEPTAPAQWRCCQEAIRGLAGEEALCLMPLWEAASLFFPILSDFSPVFASSRWWMGSSDVSGWLAVRLQSLVFSALHWWTSTSERCRDGERGGRNECEENRRGWDRDAAETPQRMQVMRDGGSVAGAVAHTDKEQPPAVFQRERGE